MVEKVRTSRPSGVSTHATTVFLCTSSPAQRSWTTRIANLLSTEPARRTLKDESALRASRRSNNHGFRRPPSTKLSHGLEAPLKDGLTPIPTHPPIFIHLGWRESAMWNSPSLPPLPPGEKGNEEAKTS